jgi:hypothetical protein
MVFGHARSNVLKGEWFIEEPFSPPMAKDALAGSIKSIFIDFSPLLSYSPSLTSAASTSRHWASK